MIKLENNMNNNINNKLYDNEIKDPSNVLTSSSSSTSFLNTNYPIHTNIISNEENNVLNNTNELYKNIQSIPLISNESLSFSSENHNNINYNLHTNISETDIKIKEELIENNLNEKLNDSDFLNLPSLTSLTNPDHLPTDLLDTTETMENLDIINFTGTWQLDRELSDSTDDYLEAMGLPLIARQAADKLDITIIINQKYDDFIITRKTRIFTETKNLKFNYEVPIKNNLIKVTGDKEKIKTVTQLQNYHGVLYDIRTLDAHDRMHVILELQLPEKDPVITHRFFKKISHSTNIDDAKPGMDHEILKDKRKR